MRKTLHINTQRILIDTFWYWADQFVMINDIDAKNA